MQQSEVQSSEQPIDAEEMTHPQWLATVVGTFDLPASVVNHMVTVPSAVLFQSESMVLACMRAMDELTAQAVFRMPHDAPGRADLVALHEKFHRQATALASGLRALQRL